MESAVLYKRDIQKVQGRGSSRTEVEKIEDRSRKKGKRREGRMKKGERRRERKGKGRRKGKREKEEIIIILSRFFIFLLSRIIEL